VFLVRRDGEPGDHMKNKAFVTIAGQFSAGGIVAAVCALLFQRRLPCNFLTLGLHSKKLGFTIRHHRSRWLGNKWARPVFGEFRRVRPKQHLRSLTNRSGDTVIPPPLPSGESFIFQSRPLPATSTCGISHSRIPFRFAQKSPLTRVQGMKMMSAPMNRCRMKPTTSVA